MATYVVGDIHGCFREWIQLKSKIERQDANATFILVGDILDKGPHSVEMLNWAMEKIVSGSKYQMVLGNHEEEKIEWLKEVLKRPEEERWKNQSIAKELLSQDGYEFYKACCEKNWNDQRLKEILEWLESFPHLISKEIENVNGTQKYIIVHQRQQGEPAIDSPSAIIIHGHTPTTLEPCKSAGAVPGKIWVRERDINVDCGLVYGVAKTKGLFGDLAAICLENLQEFYYYNHAPKTAYVT